MASSRFSLVLILSSLLASAILAAGEDPLIRQVVDGDANERSSSPGNLLGAPEHHFHLFKQRFGKSYASQEEHDHRFSVFKANLRRAARNQRLDPSASHGVTRFSDLTPREFRKQFLGLRKLGLPSDATKAPILPTNNLPEDFDWREKGAVSPVKNQGSCGSCWSFSTTGALEGAHYLATGELVSLSEQQLVDCDHECDPEEKGACDAGCGGGLMNSAFEYTLKAGGLMREEDYPYTGTDRSTCKFDKSKIAAKVANFSVISIDEDQIAANLVQSGPLAVAINAVYMQTYIGGVSCPYICSKRLDHGVLLVGYGEAGYAPIRMKEKPYWIIKNSWGETWGESGSYGKFRKRPYRRRETTPYDRPISNPGLQSSNSGGNGWLSKFVDPAQRLIAYGAHKLFASVFRKRLPPTQQTQPPEPGSRGKQKQREAFAEDKQVETVPMVSSKDLLGSQGGTITIHDGPSSSNGGGVTDLESMLKQKSFTTHEIDRLTTLLQSRVVDVPVAKEEKSAVFRSNSFLMPGNGKFPVTPVKENAVGNQFVSKPSVLDQDIASPAELAKAYMGSRPAKLSPSTLGFPSQPWKDDSALQAKQTFRSKGSSTSTIYQSSGLPGSKVNGFITPRSRGRSAVYSMARLPYSRTQSSNMIQGSGTLKDALSGGEFSSQSALDENRFSGTRQGNLKRRSSVLDNDLESISPIRRIRQKSNLMSAAAVSVYRTLSNLDTEGQLAVTSKPATEDEQPKENGDYGMQISGFAPVSTKSSKNASKILQQLDVMVSSREKSPAKLSPSMLHGQALRSLDKIDSSKFLESVQDTKTNRRDAGMSDEGQCSMPEKKDKIEQNGSTQVDSGGDNVTEQNGSIDATAANTVIKYDDQISKPKNPGFRMSADDYEDFLDIDDEEIAASTPTRLEDGDVELISSSAEKKVAEPATVDMPPVLSGAKETKIVNGTPVIGNRDTLASLTPSSSGVIKDASIPSHSAAAFDKAPSGIFSYGEKASLRTEQNEPTAKAPLFSAASLSTSPNDGFGMKFGASSGAQPESSQRMFSVASTVDPSAEQDKNDKDAGRIEPFDSFQTSKFVPPSALASSPAVGIFSFGSGLQNVTLPGPSTSQSAADSSLSVVPNAGLPTYCSVNDINTGNNNRDSAKTTVPDLGSSIFKFGSPATSNSVPPPSTDTGVGTSQTKKETSSGSSIGIHFVDSKPSITSLHFRDSSATENKSTFVSPFGATGASSASAGSSIFGSATAASAVNNNSPPGTSTSAVTSTGGSLFSAATSTSTGNSLSNATASSTTSGSSPFSFNVKPTMSSVANQSQDLNNSIGSDLVATTGLTSSTQSIPSQFGSFMSSPFGLLTSNTSAASGKSSTSNLFSSGASFGVTSSVPSEANKTVSSTATTPSPLFGSSWSTPSSSMFSAASNSSASSGGFVFGSSTSIATTGTSVLGSSTNATSSSPFSFSAPQANAPLQPPFGGSNSSLTFASTPSFSSSPSGNNDQMRMEDSMSEDTVPATTPSVPSFAQQTVTPPSSSGFVFGSTAPAAGNPQFGSATPSAGNPQFGSATPSAGNPQFGSTTPSVGNPQFGSPFPSVGNPQFGSITPAGNMQFGSTFASAGNPQFGSAAPLTAGNPQFGSTAGNPFQFGGQPQNGSPFQASGSVEFNAGGSFSLGAGDKSNRRIVKVRKTRKK